MPCNVYNNPIALFPSRQVSRIKKLLDTTFATEISENISKDAIKIWNDTIVSSIMEYILDDEWTFSFNEDTLPLKYKDEIVKIANMLGYKITLKENVLEISLKSNRECW